MKGSLQLSINAIVILIMAIAMLGVGIFFINTVLKGQITEQIKISDDIKTQIQNQLQETGANLFLSGVPSDGITMKQKDSQHIVVAVQNDGNLGSKHYILLTSKKYVDSSGSAIDSTGSPYDQDALGIATNAFYDDGELQLDIGEYEFIDMELKSSSVKGKQIMEVKVMKCENKCDISSTETDDTIYESDTFFVTVQ